MFISLSIPVTQRRRVSVSQAKCTTSKKCVNIVGTNICHQARMRNGLSVLTDKNSLSYFLTSAHFHEVYQVLYILCIRNNIFRKKKLQNTNQEKLFNKDITNVTKKSKSVDIGMAWRKLICSIEVVKIIIARNATISSVNTSHLLRRNSLHCRKTRCFNCRLLFLNSSVCLCRFLPPLGTTSTAEIQVGNLYFQPRRQNADTWPN